MTFARRYRLDTLRRHQEMLTDAQLDVIEAATAAMVASNRRQNDADEADRRAWLQANEADLQRMIDEAHPSDVLGLMSLRGRLAVIRAELNDSPECDGSPPSPDANRTAPNTLADRDCDGTSAALNPTAAACPHCFGFIYRHDAGCKFNRAIDGATSSGRVTGQQTPGTSTAKTSRDNAPVAAGEASPAESKGTRSFEVGDRVWRPSDGDRVGVVTFVTGGSVCFVTVDWGGGDVDRNDSMALSMAASRFIAGRCIRCDQDVYEDEGWRFDDAGGRFHLRCFVASEVERDAQDFDLDAATAEADCNALEALTGPGVPDCPWPAVGDEVSVPVRTMMGVRKGTVVAVLEDGLVRVDVKGGVFMDVEVGKLGRVTG